MLPLNNLKRDIQKYGLTIALFIGLIVGFGIYVKSEKEIDKANDQRIFSLLLAHQLRQSSDDLSQMARGYVATGNPLFKKYYQDIMDIRSGLKSRPEGFLDAYWDLVLAGKEPPPTDNKKSLPLLDLMKQSGYSEKEMALYSAAKKNSDDMAHFELEAFGLSQSSIPDSISPRWKAIQLQYDANYFKAKAAIMLPINEARALVDYRTRLRVENANNNAIAFRIMLLIFISGLIFTLWRNHLTANRENIDREKAEAALRASEAGLNTIIEMALDAVIRMDERGKVTGWNTRAEEVFGWKKAEVIGFALDTLIIPIEFRNAHLRGIARFLETTESKLLGKRIEVTALRKSGEIFPVELSITQAKINGKFHFTAFVEDITERKQIKLGLEQLVAQRTLELLDAKNLAESANRAKSIFLANMSHELRTPLNSIMGFSYLLERDRSLSEENRKKLGTINRAGQHLLALINNVLEISRIEAGRTIVASNPFNFLDFLVSVQELIQERANAKGIYFIIDHSSELPDYLVGDENHFKQILINLLGNAVKYTDAGSVTFKVAYDEGEVCVEVADTGPGINKEDQEHLFQPFYQTSVGIAKGEGTGLGLAISREYCHLMGGKMDLKSEPGSGSTFTVKIPMPVNASPVERIADTRHIISIEPGQPQYRILQVDDKEDNRELVKQILADVGFYIRTASNGKEAVEVYKNWNPHFIWMDMRMPVMNGIEATKLIRSLPNGDKVKIVALTASVFEEDRKIIFDAGCDDIIKKPFDADRLFKVMGDLLGVNYVYTDSLSSKPEPKAVDLDFTGFSPELLTEIKDACARLDVKFLRIKISEINETHPSVSAEIQKLVSTFHFKKIITLCESAALNQKIETNG